MSELYFLLLVLSGGINGILGQRHEATVKLTEIFCGCGVKQTIEEDSTWSDWWSNYEVLTGSGVQ